MQNTGLLSQVKNRLVPKGRRNLRVLFGPLRGICFNVNLSSQTQLVLGLWEREAVRWLPELTEGVDCIIDVGSGEGEYALYALKKTDANNVIAVEPQRKKVKKLVANLRLNDCSLGRLDVRMCRLGVDEECAQDVLALVSSDPVLVKVDVDGHELAVLRSLARLHEEHEVRWIVETHSTELEDRCKGFFQARGLRWEIVDNAWWRVIVPEQRPIEHNRWIIARSL